MILTDDSHFSCPDCGALHARGEFLTGNTIGARYYSDGKMEAPMLPDRPFIIRCGQCALIFFLTSDLKLSSYPKSGTKIFPANDLDRKGWQDAIALKLYKDSDDELGFRIRLNWSAHDPYRNKENVEYDLSNDPDYVENIEKMLEFVDQENTQDMVLAAELNRFKGEFDRARELLKILHNEHDLKDFLPYVNACEKGINARHTRVLEV